MAKVGAAAKFDSVRTLRWNGMETRVGTAGPRDGRPVVLAHGFGATLEHWRMLVRPLADSGYHVVAPDLVGFGHSCKPKGRKYYYPDMWAEQLLDALGRENKSNDPATMVGNSIGSLACLAAARKGGLRRIDSVCTLNCAGGVNNKAFAFQDWRTAIAYPLFLLIDLLLLQRPIAERVLRKVREKETVRSLLLSVYANEERVDEELVDFIRAPAFTNGAVDSLVNIVTGSPGESPIPMIGGMDASLLVLWGSSDAIAPVGGPVGRWFQELPNWRPHTGFRLLEECNHCPHDDQAEQVLECLLPWLRDGSIV